MSDQFISTFDEQGYFSVIFSSKRTPSDDGYQSMAQRMAKLAAAQDGYLGMESVRDSAGNGITVSYWKSLDRIKSWKHHTEHLVAQRYGKDKWYSEYALRIAHVREDRYFFHRQGTIPTGRIYIKETDER